MHATATINPYTGIVFVNGTDVGWVEKDDSMTEIEYVARAEGGRRIRSFPTRQAAVEAVLIDADLFDGNGILHLVETNIVRLTPHQLRELADSLDGPYDTVVVNLTPEQDKALYATSHTAAEERDEAAADTLPVIDRDTVAQFHAYVTECHEGGASSNDMVQVLDDWFTGLGFPTVIYGGR